MKFAWFTGFPNRYISKRTLFALRLTLVMTAGGCKPKEQSSAVSRAWNKANDPEILAFDRKLNKHFISLELEGEVRKEQAPWKAPYFPSRLGGAGQRWNSFNPQAFWEQPPKFLEFKKMTLAQRAMLSPVEKYDAYMGNFSYPLTVREKARTNPFAPSWNGLCDGVAAASLLYPEPKPIVANNPQGLEVPFGSTDLKALLALYIATNPYRKGGQVGQMCGRELENIPLPPQAIEKIKKTGAPVPPVNAMSLTECEDVNAGSFHVLLANYLGTRKESFIADIGTGDEVWNFPIVKYKTRIIKEQPPQKTAASKAVKEIVVETDVTYAAVAQASWKEGGGILPDTYRTVTYAYALEIDIAGKIVGGEWQVKEYPDSVWIQNKQDFYGYLYRLENLMDLSQKSTVTADLTFQ
jgi:Transglutaminase elicitor